MSLFFPYFPALPAFPCTSGTEAPFVHANRKGRCRLGPTPVLRRPTWAGEEVPNGPNRSAGDLTGRCSPRGGRHCAIATSRALGDMAQSQTGSSCVAARRTCLWGGRPGSFSAGPCRTPQRERRIEAIPRYPLAVANGASIPFAQGAAEKDSIFQRRVPTLLRSAEDLDRRKETRRTPSPSGSPT